MFEDISKSIKATLYERTTSPLFGGFTISWSIWNYKTILVILSYMKVDEKITYIESNIYGQDWLWTSLQLSVFPLITALAFIYGYPIPARLVYEYSHKQQKKLKEVRQEIDDETPLTKAESLKIRTNQRKLQNDHDEELNKKDIEISNLTKEMSLLEKGIKEKSKKVETALKKSKDHLQRMAEYVQKAKDLSSSMKAEWIEKDSELAKIHGGIKGKESNLIERIIVEAEKLQQDEQYQDAFDKWLAIAEISREDDKETTADAYFSAAYLQKYIGKGNFVEMIYLYTKALKLKPDFTGALNNRGNVYRNAGNYEKAMADYTQAIKLKPDFSDAFNNRGIAYGGIGKDKEAIADYTQAIKLEPDLTEAFNNRGAAYYRAGNYAEAIADYTHAIKLNPNLAEVFNNRGVAYNNIGKHEEAIADYTQAIKLKPDYENAFNSRGLAYVEKGEDENALADLEKALELNPNHNSADKARELIANIQQKMKEDKKTDDVNEFSSMFKQIMQADEEKEQ